MRVFGDIVAHLLFLYVAAISPIRGQNGYRRLQELIAADRSVLIRFYRRSIAQWAVLLPLLCVAVASRSPLYEGLGLDTDSSTAFWIGYVAFAIVLRLVVNRSRMKSPARRARVEANLTRVSAIMPVSPAERRWWAMVSVGAGVGEELLYRSFLMYYFATYAPWLPWAAGLVLSSVIFGLAHLYQGRRGVVSAGALGLFFGLLYRVSGSIIPAMLVHAYVDLQFLMYWRPRPEAAIRAEGAVSAGEAR